MKIFQLYNFRRHYIDLDTKNISNLEELVKLISKNRCKLKYNNNLKCYGVYIEKIPKRISKYSEITVVMDYDNIRYFSGLC